MGGFVSDYMGLSAMFTLSSAISIASAALLIPCGLVGLQFVKYSLSRKLNNEKQRLSEKGREREYGGGLC